MSLIEDCFDGLAASQQALAELAVEVAEHEVAAGGDAAARGADAGRTDDDDVADAAAGDDGAMDEARAGRDGERRDADGAQAERDEWGFWRGLEDLAGTLRVTTSRAEVVLAALARRRRRCRTPSMPPLHSFPSDAAPTPPRPPESPDCLAAERITESAVEGEVAPTPSTPRADGEGDADGAAAAT